MLSTELEYLCTRLKCFLEGWNAFERVGIHLYTVEMLSRVLERNRQSWNTYVQVWNAFYRVGMFPRGLECFLEGWNAFGRVGMPV
jgi:NifU-like protein involved in Fe-S cluster formation